MNFESPKLLALDFLENKCCATSVLDNFFKNSRNSKVKQEFPGGHVTTCMGASFLNSGKTRTANIEKLRCCQSYNAKNFFFALVIRKKRNVIKNFSFAL